MSDFYWINVSLFLVLCGCLCLEVLSSYHVGGFFPSFGGGVREKESEEQLAAFLLAISHINNKHDTFFDEILPNTELEIDVSIRSEENLTISSLSYLIDSSFASSSEKGVDVIISSDELFSSSVASLFPHQLVLNTNTGEDMMSGDYNSPNGLNLSPSKSIEGRYLQNLLCNHFGVHKLGLITSSSSMNNLIDETICPLTVLSQVVLHRFQSQNISSLIETSLRQMDSLSCHVYVILVEEAEIMAKILEIGYRHSIFRTGRQIFVPSSFLSANNVASHFSSWMTPHTISEVMRGVIGLQLSSVSSSSSSSSSFYSSWISQSSTWCSSAKDDTIQSHYLHHIDDRCYGLNFSSSDYPSLSSIPLSALYTYDGVTIISRAVDSLLLSSIPLTRSSLFDHIIRHEYNGVSGKILFDRAGNRLTGFTYDVMIFDIDKYVRDDVFSFRMTGRLNDTSYYDCSILKETVTGTGTGTGADSSCLNHPVYNTLDNHLPSDSIPFSQSSMPSVIKVGGLFRPYDENGNFDTEQAQYLSSFLLAIKEINNKSDGVWDNLLPNTHLVASIQVPEITNLLSVEESALYLSEDAFTTGVSVIVSALSNHDLKSAHQVLSQTSIPMIHSIGNDAEFGDASKYPFKVQTSPASSYQGMVFQSILCEYFHYHHISIFASSDTLGTKSAMEIQDGGYCPLDIVSYHGYPDGLTVDEMLDAAESGGANIFVFLFSSEYIEIVAEILEKGYDRGIFDETSQLFGNEEISNSQLVRYMSSSTKATSILKGYLSLQYYPRGMFQSSNESASFMTRWRSQPPTFGMIDDHGVKRCNTQRDDEDKTLLFQSDDQSMNRTCGGLNYSMFELDGSNIAPYVGHTYDATISIGMMLDHVLSQHVNNDVVDLGVIMMESFTNSIRFHGLSGDIEYYPGMASFGYYARGNREVGHMYQLMNYQPITTLSTEDTIKESEKDKDNKDKVLNKKDLSKGRFVSVGTWSTETSLILTSPVMYRSSSNTPALDQDPDVIVGLSNPIRILLLLIGSLSLLLTVVFAVMVIRARTHKYMIASQLKLMGLILFGGMLSSIRVMNTALPISSLSCISGLWLGHLGFLIVFITLSVKTYRLYRLLGSLKRVKFTQNEAVCVIVLGCVLICVYLSFLTGIGHPYQSDISSMSHNQVTRLMKCSMKYSEFHTALFSLEALILMIGFYFAYRTKDAPDSVNEAAYIAGAVTLITVVCSLVFPIVFLIGSITPQTRQLIASISIGMVTISVMCIVFIPKIQIAYFSSSEAESSQWNTSQSQSQSQFGSQSREFSRQSSQSSAGISTSLSKNNGTSSLSLSPSANDSEKSSRFFTTPKTFQSMTSRELKEKVVPFYEMEELA